MLSRFLLFSTLKKQHRGTKQRDDTDLLSPDSPLTVYLSPRVAWMFDT